MQQDLADNKAAAAGELEGLLFVLRQGKKRKDFTKSHVKLWKEQDAKCKYPVPQPTRHPCSAKLGFPVLGNRRMFALQLHPPHQLSINTGTYLSADRRARSTRGSRSVSLSSITWVSPNPTSKPSPLVIKPPRESSSHRNNRARPAPGQG